MPRDLPLQIRENLARAGLLRFLGLPQPEMFDAHSNFAYSTVATAPSPASSGTSLVVASGDGAKFPTAPFNATVWPASAQPLTSNAEIVRVTAISTDTLTITRAQESTSARSIGVGDQIAATITAKTITDVENAGIVLLASSLLSSPASSFDFSSLPQTYRVLRIMMQLRSDRAAGNFERVGVQFNGDSNNLYDWAFAGGAAASGISGTMFQLADAPAGTSTAGDVGTYDLMMVNYSTTTFFKAIQGTAWIERTTSASAQFPYATGGIWRSTAAVNRITIITATTPGGNWVTGSSVYIYGIV